jgi:hypothetical protein
MVVDALVIYGMDLEPGHASVFLEPHSDIANDVLDEDWIIVGLHSHMTFVRPFQKRVDRS